MITDQTALFRLRRTLPARNLMIITRMRSPLGPIFTLNYQTGRVVDRNVQTLCELAQRYDLVHPGEVVA